MRLFEFIKEALYNLGRNKLRSFLAALGVLFGVASVIVMMAIGNGSAEEVNHYIKLAGVNNIIIKPASEKSTSKEGKKTFYSEGLTLKDVRALSGEIPTIKNISPVIHKEATLMQNGVNFSSHLSGVKASYFQIYSLQLQEGSFFNDTHEKLAAPVCVIGDKIRDLFFSKEEAIGKYIKCENTWLKVIGVLQEKYPPDEEQEQIGLSNFNNEIYIPYQTALLRIHHPFSNSPNYSISSSSSGKEIQNQTYSIIVHVSHSDHLYTSAKLIEKILLRTHNQQKDFEISIPEELLKQQQKTKDTLRKVLITIASVSLLIGGIGIMNIMYATVLERTKEMGIKRAVGAKKREIILQFIIEASMVSLLGGFFGILLGTSFSFLIEFLFDIRTILNVYVFLIPFLLSIIVGIFFGIAPAIKSVQKAPIDVLRYE